MMKQEPGKSLPTDAPVQEENIDERRGCDEAYKNTMAFGSISAE